MGKRVRILNVLTVKNLSRPGLHYVGGIANLALQVTESGSRSWILRYSINGKRRDMGLGSFPEVSLAQARDLAAENRLLLRRSLDPIQERKTNVEASEVATRSQITFMAAAEKYIEAHRSAWKNGKHGKQWEATLEKYAYPTIGFMDSNDITLDHILKIIEPLWSTKTETASRLRGRIEAILDWATVRGFRRETNPARWKGNLETLLPPRSKVAKVKHFEALAWEKCPGFFKSLPTSKSVSVQAVRFCILTACRSGEVRGALWSEFDLKKAVWTIPAERMKAGREHRVPLSKAAVKMLEALPRLLGEEVVFANSKGTALSDMALLKVLRDLKCNFTVHGFRSSFRDWAGEATQFPREVIEHALAHQLKDKAEAAYARGDLFTKRIALMQAWADFLGKK